jgi:hypothetical protein
VLGNFPNWSDRKIREACSVDHKTVSAARMAAVTKVEGGEIPQSESGPSEPAHLNAELDRVVARLSKDLGRVLAGWPASRRPDLDTSSAKHVRWNRPPPPAARKRPTCPSGQYRVFFGLSGVLTIANSSGSVMFRYKRPLRMICFV